ncbi:hypothetical protein C8J57DRAFT_1288483 [Mycena rebaudengoi]|nr:hypothetical protein C8J57DRAFT_1288483 [Mycena rebaudengoi]
MPVSFSVANHSANPVSLNGQQRAGVTAAEILSQSSESSYAKAAEVLQSSLVPEGASTVPTDAGGSRRDLSGKISNLIPQKNGFIDTIYLAYAQRRPDDIWMMILLQFNYFVNANSESLRAAFVAHADKLELIVGSSSLDFGPMAVRMTQEIEKNVVDPSLRAWVLPTFSTTTAIDTTVFAVIMMATLKTYFSYTFMFICGIPRVTLEGEKSDWVRILERLEKLKEYGIHMIAWYHLLYPVISRLVAAFDAPDSPENVDFWQRVARHDPGGGCGLIHDFYSGWITAFYVFSKEGRPASPPAGIDPASLSAKDFWATYALPSPAFKSFPKSWKPTRAPVYKLKLDDTTYHFVDSREVPPGTAEVDVKVIDRLKVEYNCTMTAGLVGTQVTSSGDAGLSSTGKDDTVRPMPGWWMFVKKPETGDGQQVTHGDWPLYGHEMYEEL